MSRGLCKGRLLVRTCSEAGCAWEEAGETAATGPSKGRAGQSMGPAGQTRDSRDASYGAESRLTSFLAAGQPFRLTVLDCLSLALTGVCERLLFYYDSQLQIQ